MVVLRGTGNDTRSEVTGPFSDGGSVEAGVLLSGDGGGGARR